MSSISQVNTSATPPAAAATAASTAANIAVNPAPTIAASTGGKAPKETQHEIMIKDVKKLFEGLVYPDGEITVSLVLLMR